MNTADIITEMKQRYPRKHTQNSFMKKITDWRSRQRLINAWANRNLEHGEVMMESLELKYIPFSQNIFVEDTKELSQKLSRIGFEPLVGFPDEKLFEGFSRIMYNKKHNISISLYQPEHSRAINTAIEIATQSAADAELALTVFLKAVMILINEQQSTTKKQVLLG
jgi:hypothetical protein